MPDRATTIKKLDLIRIVAAVDLALLLVLVGFLVAGSGAVKAVVGPVHGMLVLLLLYLTIVGVGEKRWTWIFPVTTLIPIFALLYDAKLRREVTAR